MAGLTKAPPKHGKVTNSLIQDDLIMGVSENSSDTDFNSKKPVYTNFSLRQTTVASSQNAVSSVSTFPMNLISSGILSRSHSDALP